MSKELIHTPEGVRDIYGKEIHRKLHLEEQIHQTFFLYGYQDIQTPSFEFKDVFSKEIGTTPSKEMYQFFDKEGNTLVLRPDFTPSIARCAAKYHMDDEFPVRFCYIGNTFTNVSNLQGKLKEVTQMGAELINDGSVEADAEMLSMVIALLKNTGLKCFQLTVGNEDFFKGLCEEANLDEDTEKALRDYISGKNYFGAEELLERNNVSEPHKSALLQVADLYGNLETICEVKKHITNERALNAIARLEAIYEVLKLYGCESYVCFDLGMLSKYHYYTGLIFKAYTYGLGDAVVKGGRYNNLLQKFGKDAAAIGFCVVIDELMEALDRQKVCFECETQVETIYYKKDNYSKKLSEAITKRSIGKAVCLVPAVEE